MSNQETEFYSRSMVKYQEKCASLESKLSDCEQKMAELTEHHKEVNQRYEDEHDERVAIEAKLAVAMNLLNEFDRIGECSLTKTREALAKIKAL